MKKVFKPLGIAAAVAAASAGFVNVASAQPALSGSNLGDLALVPYYTVNDDWITGIHIVNTSAKTQVVKFRFRRAKDSLDALDFNIVMSPKDVYAGSLRDDGDTIFWSADDTTCTVPATDASGRLVMPEIYREGAETGYVEIIAMGAPTAETLPIAVAAKHSGPDASPALTPKSCSAVRSNFFADGVSGTTRGVIDNATSFQVGENAGNVDNVFEDSEDVLKVSYFMRDNASGIEFGDNAVHLSGFLAEPAITNQQYGYFSGDLNGFDFPDLDGGDPVNGTRGVFDMLRQSDVLGVDALHNEWAANPANGAYLDWVVTMPGQYTMFNVIDYLQSKQFDPANTPSCDRGSVADKCDFRDIPVEATLAGPWNREETAPTDPEGDLTVSPAPPGEITKLFLEQEVNVITFGRGEDTPGVLGVVGTDLGADLGQPFGWLSLSVKSNDRGDIAVCEWDETEDNGAFYPSETAGEALTQDCTAVTNPNVPIIGFAAWGRSVAANPDASYGRIVAHSTTS